MEHLVVSDSGRYPILKDQMELLDEDHFDGVVQILHRATSSTLYTRAGGVPVQLCPSSDPSYLLALTIGSDADLDALEIDGLEFRFGDAVFTIDRDAVRVANGMLHVQRPRHLYSSGIRGLELVEGASWLRLTVGRSQLRLQIQEFSVDEIVVVSADAESLNFGRRPRHATIDLSSVDGPARVPCRVAFKDLVNEREILLEVQTSPRARAELARAYSHFRFPRLRDRGSLEPRKVIDLFERSGYLALRETEGDGPSAAWCRPDFAEHVSVDTVYQAKDGTLLGHVSVTRAYSRTWLGHQLATLKGHSESAACRAALYHHFATIPTLRDGLEDTYLLGYYDPELRWHQLFFEGFENWVGDLNRVAVLPFDRFEPREADAPTPTANPPAGVEIRPGTSADVPAAVRLIREKMPDLAVRAFDINEDNLISEYLHPDYEHSNAVRKRRALVAYRGDVLVGVALCELGSQDLSLFNLLNLAQVYTVEADPDLNVGLFQAVRAFYANLGIYDPVLVAPPMQCQNPGGAGLRLDETMGCIIWSGETLEQYHNYVQYCFEKISGHSINRKTG